MKFCRIAAVYVMCLSVCAASGDTLQPVKSILSVAPSANADGPRTGAALTAPAAKRAHVPQPQPSSQEQAKLLHEVRDYAINYTRRLPDFVCLEQTSRY